MVGRDHRTRRSRFPLPRLPKVGRPGLPTNKHRSAWAHRIVVLYARDTGLDPREEVEEAIGDLLADLRHFCDQEGLDFHALNDTGQMHYGEEIKEGA